MKTLSTNMDLYAKFHDQFLRDFPFAANEGILLAVSGGVDSMVLAHLCHSMGLRIAIAHCNFLLRGADADQDELHVKEWAETHQLPFFITQFDTATIAAEWKKSIQETARDLRYDWLRQIAQANGYRYIATAHQANDNAETLLINLFRGTGISGLHGIPKLQNEIIRPLLFASREEVGAYATEQQIGYREDVSNSSDKYLRNAVRLNILPVVEQHFPGVVNRLNENISRFQQVELLYRKAVNHQLHKLVEQRGHDIYLPVRKLLKQEALETLFYELFKNYGYSSFQIPQLINLLSAESGRYVDSESWRVLRHREFLIITSGKTTETDLVLVEKVPVTVDTGSGKFKFSKTANLKITENPDVALMDADKLSFPLVLRKWRTGDYFYPLGMGMKKKKLSRFFIDQKLPLHEKDRVWVLESNKRVVWVAGLRLDERFKVTAHTRKAIKVEFKG